VEDAAPTAATRMNRTTLLVATTLALASCGGSGDNHNSQNDTAGVLKTTAAFVAAIRQGDTDKQCPLLIKTARKDQGCGTAGQDIGPTLNFAVRSVKSVRGDVKIIAIGPKVARIALPDCWLTAPVGYPQGKKLEPVIVKLERVESGEWKVSRFENFPCG
jgi:hypothetical protein